MEKAEYKPEMAVSPLNRAHIIMYSTSLWGLYRMANEPKLIPLVQMVQPLGLKSVHSS
jgi:hypothetical protein